MIKNNLKILAPLPVLGFSALMSISPYGFTKSNVSEKCSSSQGFTQGAFYTLFKVSLPAKNCMDIERARNGKVKVRFNWRGNSNGDDMVGGIGWKSGNPNRRIKYKVTSWRASENDNSNRNQFGDVTFGLYGWTCESKIVEYYIIDRYTSDAYLINGRKVPFDNSQGSHASSIGSGVIDGATYDFYETTQVDRPHGCGSGTATFSQVWSVRRGVRSLNREHTISFGRHKSEWQRVGVELGNKFGYQVIAPEGIGHSNGVINYTVDRK